MYDVSICIPTYKRPSMLEQLLDSIGQCNIDKSLIKEIYVVVMDNDAEKTAEGLISKLKDKAGNFYNLHYHNYTIKGLANVRNELLKKAFQFKPDFIIFIDDDEYVTVNWLNEMVLAVTRNNSDAVRGPVIARTNIPVKKDIERLLEREKYENNSPISTWTTGNLIIRRTSLEKYNIWFDKRFNNLGSEDTFFGRQMTKNGATIFWASNAIAYEVITENRTKFNWFIKRTYRVANMHVFMLKLEKDYIQLFKKAIISIAYIIWGLFTFIFLLFPFRIFWYRGMMKLSEGIGGLAGLFNIQYKEYK